MARPWDAKIRQLRRRSTVVAAIDWLGRSLMVALPLGLLCVALTRISPWARFFAPYVAASILALVSGAAMMGAVAGRRSRLFYAKWIDLENHLEDRLTSTIEWQDLPALDPFQAQCIEQLTLELRARREQLVLPRLPSARLPLTFAALSLLVAVFYVYLRKPPPVFERDAHDKVAIQRHVTDVVAKQLGSVQTAAQGAHDPELERWAADVNGLLRDLQKSSLDREATLSHLEDLNRRLATLSAHAGALKDLASNDRPGALGQLARAIGVGDAQKTQQALEQVASALNANAYSDEELAQLESMLDVLAGMAEAGAGQLAQQFAAAKTALKAGDQSQAGHALNQAIGKLNGLSSSLASVAAVRNAEHVLGQLHASVAASAKPSGEGAGAGSGDPDKDPTAVAGTNNPLLGEGTGAGVSTTEHEPVAPPQEGAKGQSLKISGTWAGGHVLRQLFDSNTAPSSANAATKQLLAEHKRVVEDRFRHDEIPLEYQDAVRHYFANLTQKENQWTQPKK